MIDLRGDRRIRVVVLAVILVGALGAVSLVLRNTDPPARPIAVTSTTSASGAGSGSSVVSDEAGVAVDIKDFAFSPDPLAIAVGSTVTWTNSDGFAHTATAVDASMFDSGKLASGQAFSHRFDVAGTYAYKCAIHNSMTGTIVVK